MSPSLVLILVLIAAANGFVLGIQYQEWLIARQEEEQEQHTPTTKEN